MSDEMPFGKHEGELIEDLPTSYLRWMLENFSFNENNAWLEDAMEEALEHQEQEALTPMKL